MLTRKERTAMTPGNVSRDPFAILRQMTAEFDRMFGGAWPTFRGRAFPAPDLGEPAWAPQVEVLERENRLVTRVDLPGVKKENVKVEVTDGQLAISGERKKEFEEKKGEFFRSEVEYGSFYRAFPLPEGVKLEDVKATFADGVLEVSIPLPARAEEKARQIPIEAPQPGTVKPAA